jgi:hypothetical protein
LQLKPADDELTGESLKFFQILRSISYGRPRRVTGSRFFLAMVVLARQGVELLAMAIWAVSRVGVLRAILIKHAISKIGV